VKPSFYSIRDIVKQSFKTIDETYEKKELVTGVPQVIGISTNDGRVSALGPHHRAGGPAWARQRSASMWLSMRHRKTDPCRYLFSRNVEGATRHSDALFGSSGRRTRLRTGFLSESDWPRLTLAAGNLSDAPSLSTMRQPSRSLNSAPRQGGSMLSTVWG